MACPDFFIFSSGKISPQESRAEFRPQTTESNGIPSFPGTCAWGMTRLMTDGVTISKEIEPRPSCSSLSKKARRSAHGAPPGPCFVFQRSRISMNSLPVMVSFS